MQANSNKSGGGRGSWIVTIALSGAAAAYLFYSFFPTAAVIHQQREEIRKKQEFINQSITLPQMLAETQKQIDRAHAYSTRWHARLATRTQLPALLAQITKQADLAGTSTTRFEPKPSRKMGTLDQVPISFGTRGTFVHEAGMLAQLEELSDLIWVDELRLTCQRENGKAVECELKLIVFAGNSENSD
jgi:Tfp pilus assembly protein PilO